MRQNGNHLRREVRVGDDSYVVVSESRHRLVLERLFGDFSDYRKRLGLKQQVMAATLGLSQTQLSKMESGLRPIKPEIEQKCRRMIKAAQRAS